MCAQVEQCTATRASRLAPYTLFRYRSPTVKGRFEAHDPAQFFFMQQFLQQAKVTIPATVVERNKKLSKFPCVHSQRSNFRRSDGCRLVHDDVAACFQGLQG